MEPAKLLQLPGVQQNMTLTSSTGHYAQPQPAKPFHGQKNIISISKSIPIGLKMESTSIFATPPQNLMGFDFIYIFNILNIELRMNIEFLPLSTRNNIDFARQIVRLGSRGSSAY